MHKTIRALTYGSVLAAAVAAALPAQAEVTRNDRVGTPWQVTVPPGYVAPTLPAGTARVDRISTLDGVIASNVAAPSPQAPSSTAGANAPVTTASTASAGANAPSAPVYLGDYKRSPDRAFIVSNNGSPNVNVNWGDVVNFQVRDPNGQLRIVNWRFNGMDNVVRFSDIDPQATWASNIRVFVNQATNPLNSTSEAHFPF